MEDDRRKAVRIKKSLTVLYRYNLDAGKKIWDETVIKDISETGISILTVKPFQPNDEFDFRIKLPMNPRGWSEFKGRAIDSKEMIGIREDRIAGMYVTRVEFVGLTEEEKGQLRMYIAWFLSKEGGKP